MTKKIYDVIIWALLLPVSQPEDVDFRKRQDGGQLISTNEIENYLCQQLKGESRFCHIARITNHAVCTLYFNLRYRPSMKSQ